MEASPFAVRRLSRRLFLRSALGVGTTLALGALASPAALGAPLRRPLRQEATPGTMASTWKGTLTFWNTMRDFEAKEVQKLIDAWQANMPGITVKMELVPFDGAREKYANAANAGNAPDVFRSDIGWTSGFADQGLLLPLDKFVTAAEREDYLAGPLATNLWAGQLYGLPHVTDALGLLYNKTLVPTPPATMDEFVSIGKPLTDLPSQKYGFYMRGDSYWLQPFIWAFGGGLFTVNEQGKVTSIDINSENSVRGLEFLLNNVLGVIAPKTWDFKTDYDNMNSGFKAGTTAMIFQGPWQVADLLTGDAFKDNPANLGIAPIPAGPEGKTGSPIGGHNYVLYAGIDDEEKAAAAYQFIRDINSVQSQAALAKNLGLLPTHRSAYDLPEVASSPIIAQWRAVLDKATNRAGIPEAPDIYTSFTTNFQAAVLGEKSPKEALDAVASAWATLFKARMA